MELWDKQNTVEEAADVLVALSSTSSTVCLYQELRTRMV